MSPIDLRLGRWQDALSDVTTCDAVICDPPYSARTDNGYRTASDYKSDTKTGGHRRKSSAVGPMPRTRFELAYKPIDELMAKELAEAAHKWDAGWAVVFGDHESFRWHEAAFQAVGWLTFAPVVWVRKDSAPRFFADGPANAAEYILVARPRRLPTVRFSRPGIYESGINRDGLLTGAKPVDLMRAIVRDYSEPGDLIVDPFCGSGTTALAAAMEGRRCITSEEKPEHYAIAKRRLDRGYQPCLLT